MVGDKLVGLCIPEGNIWTPWLIRLATTGRVTERCQGHDHVTCSLFAMEASDRLMD